MGLAVRGNLENGIAQSEVHRSYYAYTMSIDLYRVGIDGEIDIDKEELLAELNEMEAIQGVLLKSLSLSTKVCPTCGKRL